MSSEAACSLAARSRSSDLTADGLEVLGGVQPSACFPGGHGTGHNAGGTTCSVSVSHSNGNDMITRAHNNDYAASYLTSMTVVSAPRSG